jgi:membrane protein DedA with SNARE-associated domain
MLAEILDHAAWIVFALVLANQAGVPVFAAPVLLGMGALAARGDVDVVIAATVAIGAALGADLAWYGLGRWRGGWALTALRRLPGRTGGFVDHAERLFIAHDRAFQVGARFLPELNPVAAALAGAARTKPKRFVVGAVTSAAVWVATWIGAGYLIGGAVSDGGGSSLTFLVAIVAVAAVALLSVVLRPAMRATVMIWLFRRCGERGPATEPRAADADVAAGRPAARRGAGGGGAVMDMNEYTLEVLARERMAQLQADATPGESGAQGAAGPSPSSAGAGSRAHPDGPWPAGRPAA